MRVFRGYIFICNSCMLALPFMYARVIIHVCSRYQVVEVSRTDGEMPCLKSFSLCHQVWTKAVFHRHLGCQNDSELLFTILFLTKRLDGLCQCPFCGTQTMVTRCSNV
ncbi:hypothetical protein V8C35DRAFT_292416 [Trichoderma chlorosporum]